MSNEDFINQMNLRALLDIESCLYTISTKKSQCDIAKQCKNYLSVISEETLDGIEKIATQEAHQQQITKMIILERVCMLMLLYETLNQDDSDESNLLNLLNASTYIYGSFLIVLEQIVEKYNFSEKKQVELEKRVKNIIYERKQQKKIPAFNAKKQKYTIINNYSDIVYPMLNLIITADQTEPYLTIG